MRLLTLDSALARVSAALIEDGNVRFQQIGDAAQGQPGILAGMAASVLARGEPSGVAVTVGPGGFTGIRSALAVAHGIALALGVPVIGVTVGEALTALASDAGHAVWVALDNRRGRVFLDTGRGFATVALHALPRPDRAVLVLGDAAPTVARAVGEVATAGPERLPEPLGIALAAEARLAGRLPSLPAQPLYIDRPAVKLSPAGLRPAPAG